MWTVENVIADELLDLICQGNEVPFFDQLRNYKNNAISSRLDLYSSFDEVSRESLVSVSMIGDAALWRVATE